MYKQCAGFLHLIDAGFVVIFVHGIFCRFCGVHYIWSALLYFRIFILVVVIYVIGFMKWSSQRSL